ncbi:MAG: hypothetical protein ACI8UO_000243 [Verrucomicrobiales bacterium]|jgi:hypothetical protein
MFSKPHIFLIAVFAIIAAPAAARAADEVYETPSAFIAGAFSGGSNAGTITIAGDTAEAAKAIFDGRAYRAARVRYYQSGERTAWVLEEIGKTKPITVGIVVDGGKIDTVKVLVYRESIGSEVQRPAFTKQFRNTTLKDDRRHTLSRRINGISGATLSVNALNRLSRFALLLHDEVVN